jgi:hypothetical protein
MLYRSLPYNVVQLGPNEEFDFDAGTGRMMVSPQNSKIFIHWFTDTGSVRSTYTATTPTYLKDRVKLINGLGETAEIYLVKVD